MNARIIVILFLGIIALVDVSLIGALALDGDAIPDVLRTIVIADVTGMLGVLVPPPNQ